MAISIKWDRPERAGSHAIRFCSWSYFCGKLWDCEGGIGRILKDATICLDLKSNSPV
jgi:hypothetical protein